MGIDKRELAMKDERELELLANEMEEMVQAVEKECRKEEQRFLAEKAALEEKLQMMDKEYVVMIEMQKQRYRAVEMEIQERLRRLAMTPPALIILGCIFLAEKGLPKHLQITNEEFRVHLPRYTRREEGKRLQSHTPMWKESKQAITSDRMKDHPEKRDHGRKFKQRSIMVAFRIMP
ncbi:hypothetical protein BD779DRAFT_1466110 [Infundibulicybe gibba]|nr:hypothetical protein BD779DRAFT_1466110 [Infundibulicybe gibba]